MNYTSTPRLELAATVLSTTVSSLVKKKLGFDDIAKYYWTDSQVAIDSYRNT